MNKSNRVRIMNRKGARPSSKTRRGEVRSSSTEVTYGNKFRSYRKRKGAWLDLLLIQPIYLVFKGINRVRSPGEFIHPSYRQSSKRVFE